MFSFLRSWVGFPSFSMRELQYLHLPLFQIAKERAVTYRMSYRTTYIGQVMAQQTGEEPDTETATRMGYLALLWFSLGIIPSTSLCFLFAHEGTSCCRRWNATS